MFPRGYQSKTESNQSLGSSERDTHWKDDAPTPAYWKWREKGLNFPDAVRWPNGFHGAKLCMFHLLRDEETKELKKLDYITARKQIYYKEYARLARKTPEFKALQSRVKKGEKIQINEVDGPSFGSTAPFDQVVNRSLEVSKDTVKAWLFNTSQPFGHGICLAVALLDWDLVIEDEVMPEMIFSTSCQKRDKECHLDRGKCTGIHNHPIQNE